MGPPRSRWPCGAAPLPWLSATGILPAREDAAAAAPPPQHAAAAAAAAACAAASGPCTLLVHEATFEDVDGGAAQARERGHATASEALGVARRMRARHTLLTHFSARYPKAPVLRLEDGGGGSGGGVFVAYDLLSVRGRDRASGRGGRG